MDTDDGPGGTTWDDLDNVGANLEAMLQEQDVSGGLDESPVPTPGPQRSYPPPQPAGQPLPREDIVLPSPPPPALSVDPGQTSDSLSELEEQAKKAIEDADGDNLLSPT